MRTLSDSSTISFRTLSWICFALVAIVVAFWVVYFPIERAHLRPLVENINAEMPASSVFFLGGAWWRVPMIAAPIGALSLGAELLIRNKLFSVVTHVMVGFACVVSIVVYREGLFVWFVELAKRA